MGIVYWLFGFFLTLPMKYINIDFFGFKIEDAICCLLLFAFLFLRGLTLKAYGLAFCFVAYIAYGMLVALVFDGGQHYEVVLRILQVTMIVLFLSALRPPEIVQLVHGVASGGVLLAIILIGYIYLVLDFSVSDLIEDKLLYKDYFNDNDSFLRIHINSVGGILCLAMYCNVLRFELSSKSRYLLYSVILVVPSLMLFSKADILAWLSIAAIYTFRKHIVLASLCAVIGSVGLILAENIPEGFDPTRVTLYSGALRAFFDNPLGYGLGSQIDVMYRFAGICYPAHNFLLSAALEAGIFGVLFFLILLVTLFLSTKDAMTRCFIIAFIIIGSFGNVMYFYKYHFVFFAFVIFNFKFVYAAEMNRRFDIRKATLCSIN